jgi:predicted ATPase
MIKHATFANYKALRRVDVDLTPFTVIVGKNGTGKTSVLQGLHDLLRTPAGPDGTPHWVHGPRPLVTRPRSGPLKLAVTDTDERTLSLQVDCKGDEFGNEEYTYACSLGPSDPQQFSARGIHYRSRPFEFYPSIENAKHYQFVRAVQQRFGAAVLLRLDARVMARESATLVDDPVLAPDGEGLASVLNYLAGADPDALDAIRRDLATVVPQVRAVRTFPARVKRTRQERLVIGDQAVHRVFEEEIAGHRFALDMGKDRLIEAELLSEGTVLALGLLTALRHPNCPRLVLLDDIDGALHSAAQAELVRSIRSILAARPDVQVVCSSHSPDLLDNVSLEEIRVMALDRDGYAKCGRLADHPESERWRNMLRTGEFWSSVGDEWLLEGRADD